MLNKNKRGQSEAVLALQTGRRKVEIHDRHFSLEGLCCAYCGCIAFRTTSD